jgi:DNA-binding MarR family transcriptional regulator
MGNRQSRLAGARTSPGCRGARGGGRIAQPRPSKLVAETVETGVVCRQADQTDGGRSLLTLTDAGRALIEQVHR